MCKKQPKHVCWSYRIIAAFVEFRGANSKAQLFCNASESIARSVLSLRQLFRLVSFGDASKGQWTWEKWHLRYRPFDGRFPLVGFFSGEGDPNETDSISQLWRGSVTEDSR